MVLSVSAVFIHFIMSLETFRSYVFMFWYAFYFTLCAMGAMVIAVITGAYALLGPSSSSWLAIVTIFIRSDLLICQDIIRFSKATFSGFFFVCYSMDSLLLFLVLLINFS
ncbi:hypothetical protein ACOSQ2_008089 [Xanthoceras sorbifolium]